MAYTTIDKPTDYFETLLWTGNGNTPRTFTGLDFAPNMTWSKRRDDAAGHNLLDTVRGAGVDSELCPSTAGAEGSNNANTYGYLSAFTSDGFTVTAGSGDNAYWNNNTATYVAWNWKAGTTISSTSTSGSGTAKTYTGSVSTASGFSIIRYVGNGTAGHTIPHHLGAKPDVILVKHLGDGQQWATQWSPLGATKVMRFATTNAVSDSNTRWNDTEPTTSVFTLGNEAEGNTNDGNHIAYCFTNIKGYSKIGKYTGNGNADGTFVYTGFSPAFTMTKRTDGTSDWQLNDNKRDSFNPSNKLLLPNTSAAEATSSSYDMDFLSNGFKFRNTLNNQNNSGSSYIYMAFAENPFVTSTGISALAR